MILSDILDGKAVKVLHSVSSKKRLFREIAAIAESCYGMPTGRVLDALLDRENLGTTTAGQGITLPHARMPEVSHVKGVFLRLEEPIDLAAADRLPVDLVFALFAPETSSVEHLKALALVSRTLRDPDIRAKLRANDDAATLHAILTEQPATQAA